MRQTFQGRRTGSCWRSCRCRFPVDRRRCTSGCPSPPPHRTSPQGTLGTSFRRWSRFLWCNWNTTSLPGLRNARLDSLRTALCRWSCRRICLAHTVYTRPGQAPSCPPGSERMTTCPPRARKNRRDTVGTTTEPKLPLRCRTSLQGERDGCGMEKIEHVTVSVCEMAYINLVGKRCTVFLVTLPRHWRSGQRGSLGRWK